MGCIYFETPYTWYEWKFIAYTCFDFWIQNIYPEDDFLA